MYDNFRDCFIFKIKDSELVIIAMYIPPSNSLYYDRISFYNLQLIYEKFRSSKLLIVGDLNTRFGTPVCPNKNFGYNQNPDPTINENGRILLAWLNDHTDILILNGLHSDQFNFDSKFTCYRSKDRCSQNDIVMTNSVKDIKKMNILEKNIYSDHCAISVVINVKMKTPLNFLLDCANECLKYDHMDINKRKLPTLNSLDVNWTLAIPELTNEANRINDLINNETLCSETLNTLITNSIYKTCKRFYRKRPSKQNELPSLMNCNSNHYKAIAQIHFFTYERRIKEGATFEDCKTYLQRGQEYEEKAYLTENDEINAQINIGWKYAKKDGKKLWKMIDWKGEAVKDSKKSSLSEAEISSYFKQIYQAYHTKKHPLISDIEDELINYNMYIPILDDAFENNELTYAIQNMGKGIGTDGLASDILKMLPNEMKNLILVLMNLVFQQKYPTEWEKQILHAIPKPGHSVNSPKLRGIAVSQSMAKIYDSLLNKRFINWYKPNREQAGFRENQGCLLQIFSLVLLIHHEKENKDGLWVGFMDYEKAFDFANRAQIIADLMKNGCGKSFTKAITKMFKKTQYVPELKNNRFGSEISTSTGVAQGRKSSSNIYSFYVSDMPKCTADINTEDFMDPSNVLQLADDTTLIAQSKESLILKFLCTLNYSDQKYQKPNIDKTMYMHVTSNPSLEPLTIKDDIIIKSVNKKDGHRFLGVVFFPTDSMDEIILMNFSKRIGNITKYYAWLELNETTPIEIKLMVLESCMFNSILYGIEAWGNFECIEKRLLLTERKILKRILNVKKGTPDDLIYHELQRGDIVSKIKDKQCKFFKRISSLNNEDAILKSFTGICSDTGIIQYYNNLHDQHVELNKIERYNRILNSDTTMATRYRNMNLFNFSTIYNTYLNDKFRTVITRWRLSNHRLRIETGRYCHPIIPHNERICLDCRTVEDENHVIFNCPRFANERNEYHDLILKNDTIENFLNPTSSDTIRTAKFLIKIDKIIEKDT